MTERRADAVILGGGPAGCAAALALLRRGLTATIVEATAYDGERVGESLPPPARAVLEQLGVFARLAADGVGLDAYATQAAWGGDAPGANPFVLSGSRVGWQVDRRRFDELLADAARTAGATVHVRARLQAARRTSDGWLLTVGRERRDELRLRAAFVIDASGRRARFACSYGGARKLVQDRLVGVCGTFERAQGVGAGVLVEACREGWWYSAPLPRGRAIVALLSDADIVAAAGVRRLDSWCAALALATHTISRLESATGPASLAVHSARTQRLDAVAGTGWIAAGDSAATVDPLSSQGVLKALRGGTFAGYAVADHLGGRADAPARYASFVAAEHEDNLAARALHYGRETRWEAAPFWQRRRDPVRAALAAA
jgi:flavin-dependent dehydrogenase